MIAPTEDTIRSALACLDPDCRETWVMAGMAIHSELGAEGYLIWNEWGCNSASHKEKDAQSVWRSFNKNGVGMGSLFAAAAATGWKMPNAGAKKAYDDSPEGKAAWIWDHAAPVPDDHPYLLRKGVKAYGLRLHKDSLTLPLRDVSGALKSLQFILAYPKDGKDKLYLKGGQKAGAFFVIGDLRNARTALLVEGYATGASLFEHVGQPVIVCLDTSNLDPVIVAIRATYPRLKLLICGDNDAHKGGINPGKNAAQAAASAVIGGVGWCVPDFMTPTTDEVDEEAGSHASKAQLKAAMEKLRQRDILRYDVEKPTDFNDLTRWHHGVDRLKQQIETAVGRIGVIEVRPGDLVRVVRRAEAELLFGGGVYQRSGDLVRPVRHDSVAGAKRGLDGLPLGALRLCELTAPWLTERFAAVAQWQRFSEKDQAWKAIDPPELYAKTYLAKTGQWRAPVLTGIVECPTLRRDGSLLNQPGYDAASGLYVDYAGAPVAVAESPSRADALVALAILKEPFEEFVFAEPAMGLSIALAAVLTAVVRRSLRTAPLFAFDAPVMGAGKGLLVKVAALIATGRPAPLLSQGQDEAEAEKRLGSLLLAGVSMINLDNIERPVGGELLCSMLTEPVCNPRILGKSESPEMPCNLTMFATGNNLQFIGDMVRRVLICRLDPGVERPDARQFRRNLNEWVPLHRARLLSAALTVLRAYVVAGKPAQPIVPYGSFEEWSEWIRSALVWLGETDPCVSRASLEDDDPVLSALHSILPLWSHDLGPRAYTAADVCAQASGDFLVALLDVAASRRDPEKLDPKRVGRWLLKYKGRVAGGLRIVKGEDGHKKVAVWRVVPQEPTLRGFHVENPAETPQKNNNEINGKRGIAGLSPLNPTFTREKIDKSHNNNISNNDVHIGISPGPQGENKPFNHAIPRNYNKNNNLDCGVSDLQTPHPDPSNFLAQRTADLIAQGWTEDGAAHEAWLESGL